MPLASMHPVLSVADLARSLAWYRDVLGFATAWTFGEPASRAGVARDGLEIHLVDDGRFGPAGPSVVYFHVRGVDELHRACVAAGGDATELVSHPFGLRDFRVTDPDGNRLGFGQPIAS